MLLLSGLVLPIIQGIVPLTEYADRNYDRDIVVNIIVKKRPVNMFYEAVRITETDLPVLYTY